MTGCACQEIFLDGRQSPLLLASCLDRVCASVQAVDVPTHQSTTMTKAAEKGTKGQTLTIRATERMKFELDILSRIQHRSITAILEYLVAQAVEEGITWEKVGTEPDADAGQRRLIDCLWSPNKTERLANLAQYAPSLLSFEEEFALRAITGQPAYWMKGLYDSLPEDVAKQSPEEQARYISQQMEEFLRKNSPGSK